MEENILQQGDEIKILKRGERVGSQIENTFSAEITEWSVLYD